MRARLGTSLVLGVLLVVGCTPATSPSPSVLPSASSSEPAVSGLPPGCEPMDLRGPDGERIKLDGIWTEVESPDRGELMTWWMVTQGDCVWGAGHLPSLGPEIDPGTRPDHIQSLTGRVGSDFVIAGDILWLGPLQLGSPGSPPRYSPLRMLIEFDDAGEIFLREDRAPGERGPRCPDPVTFCPSPLLLQRAE